MKESAQQSVQGSGLRRGYRFGSTALGSALAYLSDHNSAVFDCSVGILGGAPVGCSGSGVECVARKLCLAAAGSRNRSDFACTALALSCCGCPSVCCIES